MAIYTVTNNNDSGLGSLRDAIIDANTNLGLDTINFAPSVTGSINLASILDSITDSVNIIGPGAGQLTVNGGSNFSPLGGVFSIFDGNPFGTPIDVSIAGLTITGGNSLIGAGITNLENLTLNNVVVTGNQATIAAAGIGSALGSLQIQNSTISNNQAIFGSGVATITGEQVVIQNSTIANNQNQAIPLPAPFNVPGPAGGLLVLQYSGSTLIENSTIANNSGLAGGGALIASIADTTIRNSTISGNTASGNLLGFGGGVLVLNSAFTGTIPIINFPLESSASTTFQNSTIFNNSAQANGGGIFYLYLDLSSLLTSSLVSSLTSSQSNLSPVEQKIVLNSPNTSLVTSNLVATPPAGKITTANLLLPYFPKIEDLQNAIASVNNPVITTPTNNLQVANNTNTSANTINFNALNAVPSAILESTIVAGNSAATNPDLGNPPTLFNGIISGSFDANQSLIQVPDLANITGANNLIGVAPLLGALANNGGPTQTHALLVGSPAIDTGFNPAGLGTDQRGAGFLRTIGVATDIGAFEFQRSLVTTSSSLPDLTISKTASSQIVSGSQPVTYTLTVSNIGQVAANNITVSDSLPAGLTFFTATATGGFNTPTGTDSDGNLLFTGGSLAPGASATLTVVVTTPANLPPNGYTNIATVDPRNTIPESNENNNIASASIGVIPVYAAPPIGEPLPPDKNVSPPVPIPRGFVDLEILPNYPPGTFITPELQNPLLGITILGSDNNDVLIGGAGNDTIRGGKGDDTIYGYGGNNLLIGGRGNDVIYGGKGSDTINGTNADTTGKGEKDILSGGGGTNLFVLGDSLNTYYDDGNNSNSGLEDYALITDFNLNQDSIQLKAGLNYVIGASPAGLPNGAAIFIDNDGIPGFSANDELIGILQDVSPNNANVISSRFVLV